MSREEHPPKGLGRHTPHHSKGSLLPGSHLTHLGRVERRGHSLLLAWGGRLRVVLLLLLLLLLLLPAPADDCFKGGGRSTTRRLLLIDGSIDWEWVGASLTVDPILPTLKPHTERQTHAHRLTSLLRLNNPGAASSSTSVRRPGERVKQLAAHTAPPAAAAASRLPAAARPHSALLNRSGLSAAPVEIVPAVCCGLGVWEWGGVNDDD